MDNIYVTQPVLPDLGEFTKLLEEIWDSKQLTNIGPMHRRLEAALTQKLKVPEVSLTGNGTMALMLAIRTLGSTGEVITTPFTFAATTHAIHWNGLTPVFADVDEHTYNLSPEAIEAAITPQTKAIMPVHCYGRPCDVDAIRDIADRHRLKVIYDAAHCFGVEDEGGSILRHGDMSVLSFHATKVFNTLEGGAIVCPDAGVRDRLGFLRNFGIASQTSIEGVGLNGKMNELQAAFGLLQLNSIDAALEARARVAARYYDGLRSLEHVDCLSEDHGLARVNDAYFPIRVRPGHTIDRETLFERMEAEGLFARRYFYPLTSNIRTYAGLDSALPHNLPVANRLAEEVLCLPIYPDLPMEAIDQIVGLVRND